MEKLITDDPKSGFLSITLECLQKMMLTKLFYSSTQLKNEFILTMIRGINRIFRLSNLNEETLLSLLESNSKFLINIELYQIRSIDDEFKQWITQLKDIFIKIIKCTSISFDNSLLCECLELANKIV